MTKRILRLAAATFLIAATAAEARLGETEQQLIERFGPPKLRGQHSIIAQGKIVPLGAKLHFREGDWTIACDLIDGRCLRIHYSKPGDWTDDQMTAVLGANNQGAQWIEITTKPHLAKLKRTWRRSDGSIADWSKGAGMSVTWDAYEKAKAKAEERARVEASRKPKI
jgi:hypothetical protein